MRDGAHTHHGHGGPGGLGLALLIAGGLALASVIQAILPALLIGLAVAAGLLVLGLISHAVMSWRCYGEAVLLTPAHDPALHAVDDTQTQTVTTPITSVGLPERHQHLHFHGVDPAQVAALLAAQHQPPPSGQDGDAW